MKIILILAGLLSIAFANSNYVELSPEETKIARAALHNPDLFDGDMAGIEGAFDKNAARHAARWTNRVVPYKIDQSLASQKSLIYQGIEDYHRNTCVRFKELAPNDFSVRNYVRLFYGQGCYSMIGMVGGVQDLSLGNGCLYVGTVVHEFGHALGFYHEQSRSDRDQYLILYLNNVSESMRGQFFKLTPDQNILYNQFDYNSIMIYGNKSFSMNGQNTMVARNGQQLLDPFNKRGMTSADIDRVNKMYGC